MTQLDRHVNTTGTSAGHVRMNVTCHHTCIACVHHVASLCRCFTSCSVSACPVRACRLCSACYPDVKLSFPQIINVYFKLFYSFNFWPMRLSCESKGMFSYLSCIKVLTPGLQLMMIISHYSTFSSWVLKNAQPRVPRPKLRSCKCLYCQSRTYSLHNYIQQRQAEQSSHLRSWKDWLTNCCRFSVGQLMNELSQL